MVPHPPLAIPPVLGHFIDNEFVDVSHADVFDILDPSNEKLLCQSVEGNDSDVHAAVSAARGAFERCDEGSWSSLSASERGRLLYKLADAMEENLERLAVMESMFSGKAYAESFGYDVPASIATLRFFAGAADKVCGKVVPTRSDRLCLTVREAIGVCALIIPWNFPLLILSWKLGPCLAAGNCAVIKPGEQTPATALEVASLAAKVGFPPGVINVILGHGLAVGRPLCIHDQVDKIAFTGSTPVGHMIMQYASEGRLKRVSLELGGKNPSIVFEDADFENALSNVFMGLFFNQGQACSAGSRIYVHESVYDEFVEKCRLLADERGRHVGHPLDDETAQGPVADRKQFEKTMHYIDIGKAEGACLISGGHRVGEEGYYIAPTVFSNVTHNMTIAREEIFGPVLSLISFSDEEEVVRLANDNPYGLVSSVFTRDVSRALRVAKQIRAGTVWINTYNEVYPQCPFGGYKESGIGRDLSEYALEQYTEVKSIIAKF